MKIIFKRLIDGCEKNDLVRCLIENYDISKEIAEKDVESFLKLLVDYNLLDG